MIATADSNVIGLDVTVGGDNSDRSNDAGAKPPVGQPPKTGALDVASISAVESRLSSSREIQTKLIAIATPMTAAASADKRSIETRRAVISSWCVTRVS